MKPVELNKSVSEKSRGSICFYCGDSVRTWDAGSLLDGIGGSEEATILMARRFSELGWAVQVFGRPTTPGPSDDGVVWRHFRDFDRDAAGGDVFVAWRSPDYVELGRNWSQVYHWLHDRQVWEYPLDVAAQVARILVLSSHHATDDGFADVEPEKIFCTSNGLDPHFLSNPGNNEPHRAIYATCPARGLLPVLEMWPKVRKQVPNAHLDVYYGFTEIYDDMAKDLPGLRYIKYACQLLLDQPGVSFHGMVGQHELASAFARAGVWLYPTETKETSCITAMKALAMGCLPITSGFGVLGETLGGRDLGPVHESRPITRSRRRLWIYRRRVVKAMKEGHRPEVRAKRMQWAQWARQTYSWQKVALQWRELFEDVARERDATTWQGAKAS